MENKKQILEIWNKNGLINLKLFSKEEVEELRKESSRLLNERDPDWEKHGIEGHQPYNQPHTDSKLFESVMRDKRILKVVEFLIGSDLNISNCKVQGQQTWMYFKPPGELGRDVHQNIFYSRCDWGEVINITLALNDANKENGCLYYYPGSHKEKICYPIPDELRDEERIKTNPSGWINERGKPIFVPGTYVGGEWVDKYPKVYIPVMEGSVTFLHSHVLHGSDDNVSTDKWRGAFLVGYSKKGGNFYSGEHMKRELIDVYN